LSDATIQQRPQELLIIDNGIITPRRKTSPEECPGRHVKASLCRYPALSRFTKLSSLNQRHSVPLRKISRGHQPGWTAPDNQNIGFKIAHKKLSRLPTNNSELCVKI
jgi:hypothetical protein